MFAKVQIQSLRFFPGCSQGLSEKTAVVELNFDGEAGVDGLETATLARIAFLAKGLCSAESIWWGLPEGEWPSSFLVDGYVGESEFAAWIVALIVALQRCVSDAVWRGRVLSSAGSSVRLALPYQRESVLKDALQNALRLLIRWCQPEADVRSAPDLSNALQSWVEAAQRGGLAPNTLRFVNAAHRRGLPFTVQPGFVRLGWGANAECMDSSCTGRTSNIAVRTARFKHQTSQLLHAAALPVPSSAVVRSLEHARHVAAKLGWPVVIKPSNQDQGTAVVPGIRNEAQLQQAFEAAANWSPGAVIIERHIAGDDHRILVVGGQMLMATRRIPGGVTGDGKATVEQLVNEANADPRRGTGKRSLMMRLMLDDVARDCLEEQGLSAESIPEVGRVVRLRRTANISAGGTAQDVTAQIHPDNRALAERAARIVGLDIAGVDLLCPDITRSWREVGGAICEVNAQPGFRPHWLSDPGRDVNGEVVDWLFRDKPARIPTAAIAGTNGKSTVARMLHHIWMTAGKVAGVCTTNGVWVGDELVSLSNLSGQPGGAILLADPAIEAAVFEMPRKGLIYLGHPCDAYDVAALLNVQDDHIGVDGIHSLGEMAALKAEVLERATQAVVINAEDPLCLAVRAQAGPQRHILVAREARTPALCEHLDQGGEGVFIQMERGTSWIVLAEGAAHMRLMPLAEIPATMHGLLRFNEINALFAAALAWAQGIAPVAIREALGSFSSTHRQNPGRYNFIQGFPFQVLLDYGHNPDGVRGLCEVVSKLEVSGQCRLLSLKIGNRHRAHLSQVAPVLARTFSSFVLGCDSNHVMKSGGYAGNDPEGVMLSAARADLIAQGVDADRIVLERDQRQAVRLAIAGATHGDLVVLLAEPWVALPLLESMRPAPL